MIRLLLLFCCAAMSMSSALATYVQPAMGGGQLVWGDVAMKHADISFLNGAVDVVIDESIDIPVLRPFEEGYEFDPDGTWGMIQDHAYNFQYGWNPSLFDAYPPNNAWFWIEQLDASPELKTYQRPPADPEGEPIFGTDGSSLRWRWSGTMTHNLYAVNNPLEDTYFATYRVYIGDDSTGEPLAGYTPDEVTFIFYAEPQLAGDFDRSGTVDVADYQLWRSSFGTTVTAGSDADGNSDGMVDLADYTIWRNHLTTPGAATNNVVAVAEPTAASVLWVGLFLTYWVRKAQCRKNR